MNSGGSEEDTFTSVESLQDVLSMDTLQRGGRKSIRTEASGRRSRGERGDQTWVD